MRHYGNIFLEPIDKIDVTDLYGSSEEPIQVDLGTFRFNLRVPQAERLTSRLLTVLGRTPTSSMLQEDLFVGSVTDVDSLGTDDEGRREREMTVTLEVMPTDLTIPRRLTLHFRGKHGLDLVKDVRRALGELVLSMTKPPLSDGFDERTKLEIEEAKRTEAEPKD